MGILNTTLASAGTYGTLAMTQLLPLLGEDEENSVHFQRCCRRCRRGQHRRVGGSFGSTQTALVDRERF
jgi:hypothetical protein